jgi:cation diffusion facilitator family transporter
MANRSGTLHTVYAAIVGNALVAVSKFVAAFWTGSSAMLSEAIHSLVDTGNEALLLYGEYRGNLPADNRHPLGHGREIYFWSFVVAILLFALGAGLSFYEGMQHFLNPAPIHDPEVTYLIYFLSALFEGWSWFVALRNFGKSKGANSYWRAIRRSKDPPSFIVLLEDTAALTGIAIATFGTAIASLFDAPRVDGLASIGIGCVLAAVAIILARESKGLLIGEPASADAVETLRQISLSEEAIEKLRDIWTLHLGPDRILVTLVVEFSDRGAVGSLAEMVARVEARAKESLNRDVFVVVRPRKPVSQP